MKIDFNEINYIQNPTYIDLHADYRQFLLSMTGPTVIDITGVNTDSYRVFITLLQGDEPSGLIAFHRWLTTRDEYDLPKTNLRFIICSVETASKNPLFSKRFLDGSKDINRCFSQEEYECHLKNNNLKDQSFGCYQRASLIENAIREVNPEMVIDIHNTSSLSPAFSISSLITTETLTLASFFCQTLILSDLKLGSLMEKKFPYPFITIECGGSKDEQANEAAYAGICRVTQCENLDFIQQEKSIDVIYRPLRLQINKDTNLTFSDHDEGHSGVTLKNNIEFLNYGGARQDEMIGWIDTKGLTNVQMLNKDGIDVVDQYFYIRENQLVCRQNLRIFNATSNQNTAMNDCLFYIVNTASTNTN